MWTSPSAHWFSKVFLGQLNWLLYRRKQYPHHLKQSLSQALKESENCRLIMTGDWTTTAQEAEFALGRHWLDEIDQHIQEALILPGNHDFYTGRAVAEKQFERTFAPYLQNYQRTASGKIYHKPLNNAWYWIGLDQCLPTPLWSSQGSFPELILEELALLLDQIQSKNILVAGHYPLIPVQVNSFQE
jgi:3',5'-cyclic AMP phosphodiesterase CpdA